jgi:hypothetical protein
LINNIMSLYSSNLNTLQPGEYTQPYKHATRLFVADTFRLAPKQTFLYYVVFEIDPSQTDLGGGILNSALEFANRYESLENGLLVKDIELPKFSMGTKTLNAYNRKNIIQTNISYDPISVTFHDDAANVITRFWNDYYTYYFRDSDYTTSSYGVPEKYDRRRLSGWGYSPRNNGLNSFLKSIRIFSLHNKNFTEYYLVNPIINGWRHGRHESGSNTGLMENVMTVSYETVKYFTGFINPVNVDGFSLLHYDNDRSPIAGNFLGDISVTGALNAIDGAPKDLRKPDNSQGAGGPLSSLLTVFRTYQNLKNADIKQAAATSIAAAGASVLNGVINGGISFPTDSTNSSRVLNNSTTSPISGYASVGKSNAVTFGSIAAGVALGAAINSSNQPLTQLRSTYSRGINNSLAGGAPVTGQFTRVYDVVSQSDSGISVDPSSMQPVTGTSTAFVYNSAGEVISQYQVAGTTDRSFNPDDASLNLSFTQRTTDASGRDVIVATYQDGTRVSFDEQTGDTLSVSRGSNNETILGGILSGINTNPPDTRSLVAAGERVISTGVQTITDAATGIITAVGGITSGRTIDTLAGTGGALIGGLIGGPLGGIVGGLIGRSIANEASSANGNKIGRAVSGGITPVVDRVTGDVRQGINNLTGAIQNVVGSWTGLGGFNINSPNDNLISTAFNPDGSKVETYKNGDILFTDQDGGQTFTKGTSNFGLTSFVNSIFGQNRDTSGPAFGVDFASIWTDGSGNPILDSSGNYVVTAGDRSFLPATPSDFATNYDREARDAISAIEISVFAEAYFSSQEYNNQGDPWSGAGSEDGGPGQEGASDPTPGSDISPNPGGFNYGVE